MEQARCMRSGNQVPKITLGRTAVIEKLGKSPASYSLSIPILEKETSVVTLDKSGLNLNLERG